MEQPQAETERGQFPYTKLLSVIALTVIIFGVLAGLYLFASLPGRMVNDADSGLAMLNKHFGSKNLFQATFGPIVAERQIMRLQFYQRDQVCLFRIVRYRGADGETHDDVQFFKREADKRDLTPLMAVGSQYCEYQAKGTFEFNFFVDIGDLSKWDVAWDAGTGTLTLYPPDIDANTPAELEPIVYECKADSITISEDYTREQLEKAIPKLKMDLARDQKQFMYPQAKQAIESFFRDLCGRIPSISASPPKHIIVIFPKERERAPVRRPQVENH